MRWNILLFSRLILAMSRCLPFPPPGYEKRSRPDEVNLIIKDKHKQTRHKGKKERNVERSEGKHKVDKDRKKKKHRDKKDKNKDKCRCSEEKKIVGSLQNQNVEKLDDLGKTVRNNDGATDSQMVNKITLTEHRKVNFLGKEEANGAGMQAESLGKIKFKRENGWMANGQILEVDLRELGDGFVGNFSGENQNKVEGCSCQVDKFEKNKDKKGRKEDERKKDQDKNRKSEDKKRKRKNKKEKVKERSKEKIKQTEIDGNNSLDFQNNKPSDLLQERCDSQGSLPKYSGIRFNNIPRPASSSHRICQNGSDLDSSQNIIDISVEKEGVIMGHNVNGKFLYSQSAIRSVRIKEPGQTANNFTAELERAELERAAINDDVVSNGPISSQFVGSGRKMEPCQTTSNVAMMEQEVNKSRVDKVPSSHHVVEHGRKMVRPNINQTAERQGPDASCKMDSKESKMNCIWEGHLCPSSKLLFASAKAKKKVDTCMKPPHPDSKYLNQILTIPEVEWSQFDDQGWLFDCEDSQAKRPKLVSTQIEWTKHVWAKAIHVESADVTALPFVIPY